MRDEYEDDIEMLDEQPAHAALYPASDRYFRKHLKPRDRKRTDGQRRLSIGRNAAREARRRRRGEKLVTK